MDKVQFLHHTTPSRLQEVAVLSNVQKQIQKVKASREIENCAPNKRIRKIPRNEHE